MQATGTPPSHIPMPDPESVLRTALDAAGVGLFVQAADRSVLYANPAATRILRGRDSGLVGLATTIDGTPLRDADDPAATALHAKGPVAAKVLGIPSDDGTVQWLQVSATPLESGSVETAAAVCVMVDVGEIVSGRERARRQAERLAQVLDASGVAIWDADIRADRLALSKRNFELYEIEPGQFDGTMHGWLRLIEPDDVVATQRAVTEALAGRADLDHRVRVRRKDGSIRYLRIRGRVRRDRNGRAVRMQGIALDVSSPVRETEQSVGAETIERARRMHTEMLARMGHDLRSPLNAMMGFAQLIERHPEPVADSIRQNARHIARAGTHLLETLTELLELSRIQVSAPSVARSSLDITGLIARCLDSVRPRALEHDVMLDDDSAPGTIALAGAEPLLRALGLMLRFCVRRAGPGAHVRIAARRIESRTLPRVRIDIGDDGPPLLEAERAELFEPFSLSSRLGASSEHPDNGLGLALARALIERMGGTAVATVDAGEGTLLRVELPAPVGAGAAHPGPVDGPAPPAGSPASNARNTRVLYIEDNRLNIAVLSSLFRQTPGYDFVFALDGRSGIETAERMRPDIVLLDINLPGMSGDEVFRRFRESPALAAIPCVAVSANALPDEVARYRAMGFAEYLTKPFNLQDLLELVARLSSKPD